MGGTMEEQNECTQEQVETEAVSEETPETQETENVAEETDTRLDEINEKLDNLTKLFTQKIQHTAHEEQIVDQMHAELQKYKSDMYAQLVKPVLQDVISIRDSIINNGRQYEEQQSVPLDILTSYLGDIQEILDKNNISVYRSESGDTFSPGRQRALKKVKTSAEELQGKVAESMGDGYEYLGKTILPERVSVYVYEKPSETEGDNQ
jgi:molecular chaperone GrpE (heat shock protein)